MLIIPHGILVSKLGDKGAKYCGVCPSDERNCECLLAPFRKSFRIGQASFGDDLRVRSDASPVLGNRGGPGT